MKKVIVTGMSGMVGKRLQQLLSSSYEFENMDITVGVDITDSEKVKHFLTSSKAEAVLHLAAFTNVSAAHEQLNDKEGVCYRVNVVGTENIAKACKETGKYLVHISTDYVFDGKKTDTYTEEDVPAPIEWYGQTKLWAEKAVQDNLENYVILRIAYPYQAHPMRPDLIQNIREKLTAGTLPPAFTDHVITPVFVDDLVTVFDACLKNQPKGIYHAVGSSWHSDYEVALMVQDIFKIPGTVQQGNLKSYLEKVQRPYQKTMKVSNEKLVRDLGVSMKTLQEGLLEIHSQLN